MREQVYAGAVLALLQGQRSSGCRRELLKYGCKLLDSRLSHTWQREDNMEVGFEPRQATSDKINTCLPERNAAHVGKWEASEQATNT